MSLPVYFVQPPKLPQPPEKLAQCEWFAAEDGSLTAPPEAEPADCLVFDDRNDLPQQFEPLIEALLIEKDKIKAQYILLDFERQPSPTFLSFVKALSALCPVTAPEVYCIDSAAEPIFCYCPAKETFDAFRRRIPPKNAWLELCPVDKWIAYPLPGVQAAGSSPEFFSDVLQCYYKAHTKSDEFVLHLYDTKDSFLQRAKMLAPYLKATVGLSNELYDFSISSNMLST